MLEEDSAGLEELVEEVGLLEDAELEEEGLLEEAELETQAYWMQSSFPAWYLPTAQWSRIPFQQILRRMLLLRKRTILKIARRILQKNWFQKRDGRRAFTGLGRFFSTAAASGEESCCEASTIRIERGLRIQTFSFHVRYSFNVQPE